ncbi:T9SS type B sorting domain-containing protein [Epilithonimonas sp. JDS]|uniref:T9SS type B sorting domain-containing protein n=1 Tax=Epilithonimonas sp. JDS TaxID=2902797 RepID=UPI001E3DE9E4|nr:T9SS type B sorting domain-containing protein [Epilithonimonas sp. JDS]MCD9855683.1 T9SS type B sorting domain-containing protein [Epilithonimonas sp. JDS]
MFIFSGNLFCQSFGNLASAVSINICTTTSTKYFNITNNGNSADAISPNGSFFNGIFLGEFYENSKTLNLSGGEVKSILYDNSKICEINLFYTIYEVNSRPASPIFTPLKLTDFFTCSSGMFSDNFGSCYDTTNKKYIKYKNFEYQIDLTSRTPARYVLETYFQYSGELGSSSTCADKYFINNNTQNYRAEFTILPIPGKDSEIEFCKDDAEVSLFSLIQSSNNSGSWIGPSELNGGYLGVFNPKNNAFGKYVYQIDNPAGCSYSIEVDTKNITPVVKDVLIWDDYIEILPLLGAVSEYEYSLDSVIWQRSNRFNNLVKGTVYNAFIRRINETCTSVPKLFSLLSISNFISPNGDGKNDEISFYGTEFLNNSELEIYDVNGKKVYKEISKPNSVMKWNGKEAGRDLPTSTYWYLLRLLNGKNFTGWIFLKNN